MQLSICYDPNGYETRPCGSLVEARRVVMAFLTAGYRGLSVELIDDGDVVAYYESGRGWTTD